jgi:copper chaperone
MTTLSLRIENMHCGSCVRHVLSALNALPNTHAEEVQIGSARVVTDATPGTIQHALAAAGYPAAVESQAQ